MFEAGYKLKSSRDSVVERTLHVSSVTQNKMRARKVLFTVLLVAFLFGNFVVTASLMSKELETDGKWKKINQSLLAAENF